MNIHFLRQAVAEAERFLTRATMLDQSEAVRGHFTATKHTASVRRASMDLTRALAALRKS